MGIPWSPMAKGLKDTDCTVGFGFEGQWPAIRHNTNSEGRKSVPGIAGFPYRSLQGIHMTCITRYMLHFR